MFRRKYAPKSIFMNQKVEQRRFIKYYGLYPDTHTKKVDIGYEDPDLVPDVRIRIRKDPDLQQC
jgi:hypothetical protein